ncbi:MAG: glycosyltransferase family 4 protein [Balneolia bacterium]|nr:glycosyltransferase family 4 protein [Balneolia bacterium]
MKTLFIVSKGIGKKPDEEIRRLEAEDKEPRYSLLETELNTTLLDERYLETIPVARKWLYKWMPTDFVLLLEAFIIHKQYDAVLSYYERVGLPFALLQKLTGSEIPHVLLTTWLSSEQKIWFIKRIRNHIAKFITWSSNQHRFAVEELGVSPGKIRLIKRGTDQQFWRPMSRETNKICAVGMEMRDYSTLIEALKKTEIPCHIATGLSRGQLFDTVKSLYELDEIPENITIGPKNKVELRELYAESRFVVVPLLQTDTDNGLTVILEAMSMGKAVICSEVEGQVDVIEHGKTGIYVPQGNPAALLEAIEDLWSNPEKAERIGQEARRHIEKHHTLEQFVGAIKHEVEVAISDPGYEELSQGDFTKAQA